MKTFTGLLLFVLSGIVINGQQAEPAKVIADIATTRSSMVVKGAPFSADAVNESVQTLGDGNRIVRSSTGKLYRTADGRFRQEFSSGSGRPTGPSFPFGDGISILDPVRGVRLMLDEDNRVARQISLRPMSDVRVTRNIGQYREYGEMRKPDATSAPTLPTKTVDVPRVREEHEVEMFRSGFFGGHSKWESHTDQLGVQNIEGVAAEGVRTVTTIPAGDIGNDRPIEIVYEKWYSKDLQLVVLSKHSDPRFGEQTYRLVNIVRSEPDPSLFTVPPGYKVLTGSSSVFGIHRSMRGERDDESPMTPKARTIPGSKP